MPFFDDTQVTHVGLAHLSGLDQLQDLDLGNTPVTGAGRIHLMGRANLERLFLNRAQIIHAGGVDQIRELLPHCEVREHSEMMF